MAGAARAISPWKCPNDSANWIASANSASREPVLMLFRNHFTSVYALPRRPSLDHPLLQYNIGGGQRCQSLLVNAAQSAPVCVIAATAAPMHGHPRSS